MLLANKKLEDLFHQINSQNAQNQARSSQHTALLEDISDRMATMQAASAYPNFLDSLLDSMNANPEAMLTSMRTFLERERNGLGKVERTFLETGIERLREQTASSREISIQSWTLTGLEVEKGYLLGDDVNISARWAKWKQGIVLMLELKDSEVRIAALLLHDVNLHYASNADGRANNQGNDPRKVWTRKQRH